MSKSVKRHLPLVIIAGRVCYSSLLVHIRNLPMPPCIYQTRYLFLRSTSHTNLARITTLNAIATLEPFNKRQLAAFPVCCGIPDDVLTVPLPPSFKLVRVAVTPSTTKAPPPPPSEVAARLNVVPLTTVADPPAVNVSPGAITTASEDGAAVYVSPSMTYASAGEPAEGAVATG